MNADSEFLSLEQKENISAYQYVNEFDKNTQAAQGLSILQNIVKTAFD